MTMRLCFLLLVTLNAVGQQKIEQYKRFEQTFPASAANAQIQAVFTGPDTSYTVSGFYNGKDGFTIRFMPQTVGVWRYTTKSNASALNNKKGSFECVQASIGNHGMVKVHNTYGFNYRDGKAYYPFGTTAYAWTHMSQAVQQLTLQSLGAAGFNKIRMCVFPKDYDLVKEEPEIYPYQRKGDAWDFDHFNPAFFDLLEKRIDQLDSLGIEADLILFHPYDKGRWGFDAMPAEVNKRYIQYVVARLSSFKNVWWSLANEWDYVKSKTVDEWNTIATTVAQADPYRHLLSIHGATATYFDYWKPAFTHVSIQDEAPVQTTVGVATLRNVYHKPIVCDEVGYEGNLRSRWGRYSPEEMTHLIWNGLIGGGYVTHGESYMRKDATDTIFWAKGGEFKGSSWKRVAFARKIVEACPAQLSMTDISRDYVTASAGENYYLIYFGKQVNESWLFNLPAKNGSLAKLKAGVKFKVEIIDTWDMTITPMPQTFETSAENDYRLYDKDLKKVRLPLKPYMALRITLL